MMLGNAVCKEDMATVVHYLRNYVRAIYVRYRRSMLLTMFKIYNFACHEDPMRDGTILGIRPFFAAKVQILLAAFVLLLGVRL